MPQREQFGSACSCGDGVVLGRPTVVRKASVIPDPLVLVILTVALRSTVRYALLLFGFLVTVRGMNGAHRARAFRCFAAAMTAGAREPAHGDTRPAASRGRDPGEHA